jgi:hypothetical protein
MLFVADTANHRILGLRAPDLGHVLTIGGPESLSQPCSVTCKGAELYVLDTYNRQLKVWRLAPRSPRHVVGVATTTWRSSLVRTLGRALVDTDPPMTNHVPIARPMGVFELPRGVAVTDDRIFVAEADRIQVGSP